MNFTIKDESGMTASELETTRLAIIEYLKALSPWNFGDSEITINGDGVPIYITTRKAKIGTLGYHNVENGKPAIYVYPRPIKFGRYRPPVAAIASKTIGSYTRKPKPAVPAYYAAGQISTIAHEVAEVLGNPLVTTQSNPDSLGHNYLREITYPVHGIYYKVTVNGIDCVLPDTVLPNWYELGSSAPYDVTGYCTAPFQKAPRGYAYWVNKLGKLVKV